MLVVVDIAITNQTSVFYGIQSCPISVVKGSFNWGLMRIVIFCADELHLACTLHTSQEEIRINIYICYCCYSTLITFNVLRNEACSN